MMEGSFFYWILWGVWIYLTFILSKQSQLRYKISAVILLTIILSDIRFQFGSFQITYSGLVLLLLSYFIISKQKLGLLLYSFICSFIVTVAYVTFHLFEIFDPIWIIFQKEWMMGICFGYLAILLQKGLKDRLLMIVCGTMQGELLYSWFLTRFDFSYPIGSLAYLDVCSLICLLLVGWSMLENASTFFETHFGFLEKGKQKTH